MEVNWCLEKDLTDVFKFNENSIINDNRKNDVCNTLDFDDNSKNDLDINNCFSLNLNVTDKKSLLIILNYLSFTSNYLRILIKNKSNKFKEIKEITKEEFILIIKCLDWLNLASTSIKNFFAIPIRRDNSYDPCNTKLFKTSSYKFCNFKEICSIHKNKQSRCDKNHFVFDMIINDIFKLKESIDIIGFDNLNWILSNNIISIKYNTNEKKYCIDKVNVTDKNYSLLQNCDEFQFIIDKSFIFKSFDVISYVLNKMYEEAQYFLNSNNNSLLIFFN